MQTKKPLRLLAIILGLALVIAACAESPEPEGDDPAAETDDEPDVEDVEEDTEEAEEAEDPPAETDFPTQTIDIVVPFGAGGAVDSLGRQLADMLAVELGGETFVDNVTGAGGAVGANEVYNSAPDGYTLLVSPNAAIAFAPMITPDLDYNGIGDFSAIAKLAEVPGVIVVRDEAPWETMEELLDDARERPNEIIVATGGERTEVDMNIVGLMEEAEVEFIRGTLSGGGSEALTSLLGGDADVGSLTAPTALGQVEAGELRVLGVVGSQPSELYPDATPIGELGYDLPTPARFILTGPPGIPDDVLAQLREAVMAVLDSDEMTEWAQGAGYSYVPAGHETLVDELTQDAERYSGMLELYDALD